MFITVYVPNFVHGMKKIEPEGGLRGLPPKIGIRFLLRNYTHNSDETWLQPSSPVIYQRLFPAFKKSGSKGGCPPPKICICFLLRNPTHNFDETWRQPLSPMMYQSLFTALKQKIHRYLLSSPLHILWVILAYQWFPSYLIDPLPVERPGVFPHVFVHMRPGEEEWCKRHFFNDMMMIGSDDKGRVKIVLYGINSKMADVALTSLLLI